MLLPPVRGFTDQRATGMSRFGQKRILLGAPLRGMEEVLKARREARPGARSPWIGYLGRHGRS